MQFSHSVIFVSNLNHHFDHIISKIDKNPKYTTKFTENNDSFTLSWALDSESVQIRFSEL